MYHSISLNVLFFLYKWWAEWSIEVYITFRGSGLNRGLGGVGVAAIGHGDGIGMGK